MKNAILCLLATTAVSLSLAFRVAPVAPAPPPPPAATTAARATSVAPLGPLRPSLTFRDSLFYSYSSQTLGVQLPLKEDKSLVSTILDWLGTPYRGGGSTQKGTDCSGFVMRVYEQAYGIHLVHSSGGMFQVTERVKKTGLQEGDLLFFRRSSRSPIYHVGIYLADGRFIHSASGKGVTVSSLQEGYWNRNFYAAGRVPALAQLEAGREEIRLDVRLAELNQN